MSVIEYRRQRNGSHVSISVQSHFELLNDITSKLNGANGHSAHFSRGMFERRQDFETSCRGLVSQFATEAALALSFVEKGYSDPIFLKEVKDKGLQLRMHHDNGFSTNQLSPALRHFINDYCRILEPIVKLVAAKHPGVPALDRQNRYNISFNTYIERLKEVVLPFDSELFINLYSELWNDYKHSQTPPAAPGA
jgi:hypothetical protein